MSLEKRRKLKKLTQAQISEKLGITERQFRRYVKFEVNPPLHISIKWAKLLGIGIGKFAKLYDEEKENR